MWTGFFERIPFALQVSLMIWQAVQKDAGFSGLVPCVRRHLEAIAASVGPIDCLARLLQANLSTPLRKSSSVDTGASPIFRDGWCTQLPYRSFSA